MLRSVFLVLPAFLFVISAAPARADKRVALVIGISNYQQVPPLANPARDADALSALFRKSGFDVVDSERDVGIADLRRAIREFSSKVRDADIAVIYYAGHGMEVDGTNYLVPADAKLSNDFDVEDEAVSLDRMLRALDPVKRLRLVILDACRDNPCSRAMKRTVASRSIGRGLAKVEPTMSNTLVAFAAKAGAVAEDGDGENSPFATALVRYIAEPGLDLRIAFGRVRDDVLKATDNRQEPFVYGSLGGDTVALVPQAAKPADADAQARIDYELASQIGTKEAWDSFLESHPTGLYANLARAQNSKLLAAQLSHAKADDARRDAQDKAAQKAEELRKQLDETSTRQTTGVKQKLEQTRKELEEAKKQAELAQQQAEAARQEVADARRQAAADAQRQVEEVRRTEKEVGKQTAKESSKSDAGTLATLTPNETGPQAPQSSSSPIDQGEITRLLQAHLKRVGCNTGNVDGKWDDSSKKALELFNKHAETRFDVKLASLDALDAVRSRPDRVCPLICAKGQRAEGDRCVQIGCESGYFLNSRGSCERRHEATGRPRVVIRGRPALWPQSGSAGGCGLDSSGHRDTGGFRCRD
jgi:uncharacterized caspase-like protein